MYSIVGSYLWTSLLFNSCLSVALSRFCGYNSYKNYITKKPTKTAGRHIQ